MSWDADDSFAKGTLQYANHRLRARSGNRALDEKTKARGTQMSKSAREFSFEMPKRSKTIRIDESQDEVLDEELVKIKSWIARRKRNNDLNRKTLLQMKWLEIHDKSGTQ